MMKQAIHFLTAVKSVDPRCPVQALTETQDYFPNPLTPEEAQQAGVDINFLPDYSTDGRSLGEEMASVQKVKDVLSTRNERSWTVSGQQLYMGNDEVVTRNYAVDQIMMAAIAKGEIVSLNTYNEVKDRAMMPSATLEINQEGMIAKAYENITIPSNTCNFLEGVFVDMGTGRLRYCNSKGKVCDFCNFNIFPIQREIEVGKDGEQKRLRYILQLVFPGTSPILLRITEEDLEKLSRVIPKYVDAAVITTEVRSANLKLVNYVRGLLPQMPKADIKVFCESGWQNIMGKMVYVQDAREDWLGVQFQTGKLLIVDTSMTRREVWSSICKMMKISKTEEIGVFSTIFSFMGILYSLFEEAGFPVKFSLNLMGTTGSLKTELCKVLFLVFNRNEEVQLHTFSDTATSHEKYIANLRDEVGLIDDLELGDSQQEATRQAALYNDLIRKIGDGKGKNRSNSRLENVEGTPTHGLVAITGEQIIGKQSTRLRTVEIEIIAGAVNGESLAEYQRKPEIWPTVIWHFIQFVESNFESIVQKIRYNYGNLRESFQKTNTLKRQVDQAIAFITVSEILEYFVTGYCEICNEEVRYVMEAARNTILQKYESADVEVEISNPGIRFALDLDVMINTGRVLVAQDKEKYTLETLGYEENGWIYLRSQEVYSEILKFENSLQRRFPFDMRTCFKSLWEKGIIDQFPNGSNATYTTKISFGGKRHSVIRVNKAKFCEVVAKYQNI